MQAQRQREKNVTLPKSKRSNNNEKKTQRMVNIIFEGELIGQNRGYSCKVMSASHTKQASKRPYPEYPISFSKEDLDRIIKPHEDPLVIKADIGEDCRVNKIMVDNDNVVDINSILQPLSKNGL